VSLWLPSVRVFQADLEIAVFNVFFAGPRLGDGPRWDLNRAAAVKERVDIQAVERQLQWLRKKTNSDDEDEDEDEEDKEDLDALIILEYIEQLQNELESMRAGSDARCIKMLDQALSQSEDADVQFVFEGGQSYLSGHRGMLCAGSEEFAGMFRSGMVEAQEGKIPVPPGTGSVSFRGFLEWLYLGESIPVCCCFVRFYMDGLIERVACRFCLWLRMSVRLNVHCFAGRAGEECAKADGRELWVLGEMYEVTGLLEWLLKEGINGRNVCASYEFGLVPEGVDREGLLARCLSVMDKGEDIDLDEETLRGVGKEVVKVLSLVHARQGEGKRMGWRHVRDSVRLVEKWVGANGGLYGGGDVSGFREIMSELANDLLRMPLKALREMLDGCEFVDGEWAASVVLRKEAARDNAYEVEYRVERRYELGDDFECDGARRIACHGEGSERRMAVVNVLTCRIAIVNLESGERMATFGSKGEEAGQLLYPLGVAFSSTGELYVSDFRMHRIQVFDTQGRYVRGFGTLGSGEGQFNGPGGICLTADGEVVVLDNLNLRVQVLRGDGTFVRTFGSFGSREGQIQRPPDVCSRPDGSIAVANSGHDRVVVHGKEGSFVRSFGSPGTALGQFNYFASIAAGGGGEIFVLDCARADIQVFGPEGELLQIIGPEGDSKVVLDALLYMQRIATDVEGRLYVAQRSSVTALS
jgi:hypothetical protein